MIIVRLSGGMGNQMFQYAMGRALSLRHNVPLKLDTTFLENQTAIPFIRPTFTRRTYDLGSFNIVATMAEKKDIPWYARPFFSGIVMQCIDAVLRKVPILPGWEKKFTYNPNALEFGPTTYLAGFWQSPKYFEDIADTIRDDFTFIKPLEGPAGELEREIRSQSSVCLHVRRADFATSTFHGTTDIDHYIRAVQRVQSQHDIDHIYVFSDDSAWCREYLQFATPTTVVGDNMQGERGKGHFALMKACRHFIIPNSTFSWWAAWLGTHPDKVVIAPKKWFGDAHIDDRDLIPQDWIRL